MSEIFGRLRVKEAIPYLIENIWLGHPVIRMKDSGIDCDDPPIRALIQIGPDATGPLLVALRKWASPVLPPSGRQYHLGILNALACLEDPRAAGALEKAASQPGEDGRVARIGLIRLSRKK